MSKLCLPFREVLALICTVFLASSEITPTEGLIDVIKTGKFSYFVK